MSSKLTKRLQVQAEGVKNKGVVILDVGKSIMWFKLGGVELGLFGGGHICGGSTGALRTPGRNEAGA